MLALFGAALTTQARDQIRAGTSWMLGPIIQYLPWNRLPERLLHNGLSSAFTLVQVFLLDTAGNRARYEKTTSFVVKGPTTSYQEAVTAEHTVIAFTSMRGTIVETVVERGYFVSSIDLGNTAREGERLTNCYSAELLNSFAKPSEHWTQEFMYPTEHLTLQIHFPMGRPPKTVACTMLEGTLEKPAASSAVLVDLFGRRSIVWDIANPKLDQVAKLEWTW